MNIFHQPRVRSQISLVERCCAAVWILPVLLSLLASRPACAEVDYSRPVTSAPQPENIGGDYALPPVQRVAPRSPWWYLADCVLLLFGLVASALVVHRWRRRWMVTGLMIASLAYFGFFRQGCVCPIGAIQNVALAAADSSVAVPIVVLVFFLLPLLAALFAGRVFCGAVCPLGAIQDVVIVKPVQIPAAIDRWGGLLKYAYLGLALWLAVQPAESRDFIICRFDPFVGFFRFTGTAWLLALGGGLLLVGTVIGRPYCRFLCPYGGLLALVSRYSFRPVQITPDEELECGLCDKSCPFGAIHNHRADRGACLACARCFATCPRQKYRWGEIELHEIEPLIESKKVSPVREPVA